MINLFRLLKDKAPIEPQFYAIFINLWLFIVVLYGLQSDQRADVISLFYGMPELFITGILFVCFMWPVICFAYTAITPATWMKSSALLTNTILYAWVSLTYFRYGFFTVGGGLFLILAIRYLIMYLILRVHEGGNVRLFPK